MIDLSQCVSASPRVQAVQTDPGRSWVKDAAVAVDAAPDGEVVPLASGENRMRMYYECCSGLQSGPSTIRSALSEDGGLVWTPEPGARLEADGRNFSSPRIVFLDDAHVAFAPEIMRRDGRRQAGRVAHRRRDLRGLIRVGTAALRCARWSHRGCGATGGVDSWSVRPGEGSCAEPSAACSPAGSR